MKTLLHKANTRGHADHGWLKTFHSFSFASYYNPERMNFGALRVLNDDTLAPGRGFPTHAHENMEIISIPLEGDLEHKDSMGNVTVIREGDVQIMSAGTGVSHSEYNKNRDKPVKFLQIWIFPDSKNLTPAYDQITIDPADTRNRFYQIVSPHPEGPGVRIRQNAWLHMGTFDKEEKTEYLLKDSANGIYCFLLEGNIHVAGQELSPRDALGIWDTDQVEIRSMDASKILLLEVPMKI